MSTICVVSDSHDQIVNLRAAVDIANRAGAQLLLHCGDLISPFMLEQLARFEGAVHLIYGNNIGDKALIESRCKTRFKNITHHGDRALFSALNLSIGMVHFPKEAKELASQGNYDLVCFGHSHRFEMIRMEETLLLNPGHLLGENNEGGCSLVHFPERTVERFIIDGCMFDSSPRVLPQEPVSLF